MLSLLCNWVLPSADQNRDSMQPSVVFNSDIKVGKMLCGILLSLCNGILQSADQNRHSM